LHFERFMRFILMVLNQWDWKVRSDIVNSVCKINSHIGYLLISVYDRILFHEWSLKFTFQIWISMTKSPNLWQNLQISIRICESSGYKAYVWYKIVDKYCSPMSNRFLFRWVNRLKYRSVCRSSSSYTECMKHMTNYYVISGH